MEKPRVFKRDLGESLKNDESIDAPIEALEGENPALIRDHYRRY